MFGILRMTQYKHVIFPLYSKTQYNNAGSIFGIRMIPLLGIFTIVFVANIICLYVRIINAVITKKLSKIVRKIIMFIRQIINGNLKNTILAGDGCRRGEKKNLASHPSIVINDTHYYWCD